MEEKSSGDASIDAQDEDDEKRQKEEQAELDTLVKEADERNKSKVKMRSKNQCAAENRPEEEFFHRLDSSLKKNTAFVKKLGKLTETQRNSLENEFKSLNLTRYIQEAVSTIVEAKIKMSDVACAVYLCSLLHQRYSDFTPLLFQMLKKAFQQRIDEKSFMSNMTKLRTDLRFVSELTIAGLLSDKEGLTLVYNQLNAMSSSDNDKHELLSVIISLCKHCGEDLAGLIPRKHRALASKFGIEIPRSKIFAPEKQKIFHNTFIEYWNSVSKHLLKLHKELKAIDKTNRSILQTKGELHEERSKAFQEKQASYQKLLVNSNTLADLLDEDLPDLPEDELITQDTEAGVSIYDPAVRGAELIGDQSPWEDEDQLSFYTHLLDLKAIVPAILYKDNVPGKAGKRTPSKRKKSKSLSADKPVGLKGAGKGEESVERIADDLAEMEVAEIEEIALETVKQATDAAAMVTSGEMLDQGSQDEEIPDDEEDIEKQVLEKDEETEEEDVNIGATMKLMMENFITSLQNCINRELIDAAAQDFCMNLNTRANRKKIVRVLFNVHRSRLDLLPFYGRLVATLYPCMSDIAENLSIMLLKDYRFHMRKKDQIHIESKVKTVRFIGEMTKFGMIPHSDTLSCLKQLVHDFSPHAIEMACGLLEVCGCFLFRTPETHLLTRVLLEQLMRKRMAKPLDTRYSTMIDNAYYYCNPPEVEKAAVKVRPPLHEYIRKLVYKDLSKSTVEKVLRQMRKLDWADNSVKSYATKVMTKVWNIKFNNVHCLASLVAGLVSYQDDVGVRIVDDVLEEIRIGMEINHPKFNQRRISAVKYLGELYNYRMFDSSIIFNALYSFITFGVFYDYSIPSVLDPPEHLFRIRLTCVLLETCGQYFDRGTSKKKLDYFLQYFQRYIWFKKSSLIWMPSGQDKDDEGHSQNTFPVEVDYLVQDTIEPLRPRLKLASCSEDALKGVAEVEKEVFAKLAEIAPEDNFHSLGNIPEKETQSQRTAQLHELETIPEDGEVDHMEYGTSPVARPGFFRNDTGSSQSGASDNEDYPSSEDDDSKQPDHNKETESQPPVVKVRRVASEEDNAFQKAFDSMLYESLQSRKTTPVPQQDMSVPVNMKKSLLKGSSPREDTVKFLLLTKKGNKQTLKPLLIPKTEQLAANLKDRTQAELKQKEELKKITLSINELQVEEEHQQEMFNNSKSPPANLNRERRPKYQPPKGAPNADLIFSSGGRRR